MVGNTGYDTLAKAINAADNGATITIIKAGEYDALPALTKTLTFVSSVDGVIINQTKNAEIDAEKTVTFKNIAFNLSDVQYLGFGKKSDSANGALVMEGCTIEGSLSLYGMSTFKDCKFTASGKYNIWAVLTGASFSDCSFTNTNRAVNVYDFKHGISVKNVSFSGCTFAGTEKKKAAINIHHNPDGTVAKYAVTITNCTTSGTWASSVEETGEPADATVCNSALWMVSDIKNWTNGDITVNVDGTPYVFNAEAKIDNVNYATLAEAITSANADDTIDILHDIQLTTSALSSENDDIVISKNITINGNNHTITASNGKRVFSLKSSVTLKDLTLNTKGGNTIWIGANDITVTLNNTTLDNSNSTQQYKQVVTIGQSFTGITLNVINGSVIKTNDSGSAHYDIIAWSPSTINVDNSTLKGWSGVYLKPTAGGSTVNISESTLQSLGGKGLTDAFGIISIESANNTITLNNNSAAVSEPLNNQFNTLINLSEYWAKQSGTTCTGNTIYILNGTTFTGDGTKYSGLLSDSGWGALIKDKNNNIYFDESTRNHFQTLFNYNADASISETKGSNGYYYASYIPEVYYYWYTTGDNTDGAYCKLADPFESSGYTMCDGEFIRLQKNIELSANITVSLSDYLHAGSYFTMIFGDYEITKGDYSIILPAGLSVKTDKQTNVFTGANGSMIVETVSNDEYTYTAVQSVAQIGSSYYATLEEAVAAVQSGETIVLLSDLTQDKGILYDKEGVNAKLNLNGNTITVNSGSNINSRAFRIDNGTLEVYGGSIVAVGAGTTSSDGTGCYGAFRVEANGVLNAHDLNLTNSRPWGLNVKVLGGVAELTRVNITSSYGGGIEVSEADLGTQSKAGSATLTNCTFDQKNYFDHCSTPISVSGGSELTVNGGTYTSENHVLYVFSSGGVITVNDGTFQATGSKAAIVAAIDLNTYPTYTGGLQIKGGNYTGSFAITSPAYMNITGGTFDHDPSAYVADGYASTGTGPYTVSQIQGVAAIGSQGYSTLTAAVAAATDGQTVTLLQNVELTGTSAIQINGKSITLDLNGKTITNRVSSNRTFHVYTGTLTIEGHNGQIITPDDVLNSYGFIDLKDGAANLIIKNATLEGSTQAGSLIKARGNNYQITLDHVNATTKRLGSQAAATNNPNSPGVNSIVSASYQGTLTVNGGSYSHDSWLAIYGGKPIGFAFDTEMANVSFTNVEVYSTLGTVVSAYKSTFTNCHIEDAQTAGASWAAAAIGLAHNEKNTIVSGYYKGKYGVAIWSTGAELNIEGGTFVGSEASIAIIGDDNNSNHKFIVNISGGDFTGNILVSGNNRAQISITGGTFDHDPSDYVADGYKATDNGNGTWTVMPVGTVTGDPVEEQGEDNE